MRSILESCPRTAGHKHWLTLNWEEMGRGEEERKDWQRGEENEVRREIEKKRWRQETRWWWLPSVYPQRRVERKWQPVGEETLVPLCLPTDSQAQSLMLHDDHAMTTQSLSYQKFTDPPHKNLLCLHSLHRATCSGLSISQTPESPEIPLTSSCVGIKPIALSM